jgi:hypothetical protein
MDAAEVIEREVERQRVNVVVELLGEDVRQAGEAAVLSNVGPLGIVTTPLPVRRYSEADARDEQKAPYDQIASHDRSDTDQTEDPCDYDIQRRLVHLASFFPAKHIGGGPKREGFSG